MNATALQSAPWISPEAQAAVEEFVRRTSSAWALSLMHLGHVVAGPERDEALTRATAIAAERARLMADHIEAMAKRAR